MIGSSEHTSSCYAATGNWQTNYPELNGELPCDVAVVDGGFTGVSTILHLAERGYEMALVEANRVGWGVSARNGGQPIDGFVDIGKIEKRLGKEAAHVACQLGVECRTSCWNAWKDIPSAAI
jgi:ribulose 1,5-bisphosphate synthetase/thiazole synthase